MIRSLMFPLCGVIAFLVATGRGEAGLILDQSFDASNDYFSFVDNQSVVAQTFTASQSGLLSQVDLQVRMATGNPTDDPILAILGTTGGVPDSSKMLGSVSIPSTSIDVFVSTSDGNFVSVDVSGLGILVEPGDVLALELTYPSGSGGYYWLDNSLLESSIYPGGGEFIRSASNSAWQSQAPWDAGFQTWVEEAPAVPEPSSFMLLSIGCLCGIAGTRKRRNG